MAGRMVLTLAVILVGLGTVHGSGPDPRVNIGVEVRIQSGTGLPYVVTPVKDSVAHKAGVQTGDLITAVQKHPQEKMATRGLSLEAVKDLLHAPEKTQLTLTLQREGRQAPLVVHLTIGLRPSYETVLGLTRKPDTTFDHWLDVKNRIAYVRLTQFGRHTPAELEPVIRALKAEGMKGLVLDLRFCPGGLLIAMQEIADLFIDDGVIITVRSPATMTEDRFTGKKKGSQLDFPMTVLINGETMSGAEGIAACLQDHKRAAIIGERSRGKGGFQAVFPFAGGELRLTTGLFHRPSGKTWHRFGEFFGPDDDWGIKPDKGMEIKLTQREREALQDHLERQMILPSPARPVQRSGFRDMQLERAQSVLRERLTKR